MLDLVVKCEKAREGCEWEGEIRSLDQHKSTCLHVPVPCPRECDVGSVLRGDLQSHLRDYCSQRDYECPHCLQMGRYRERVTSHLQDCPMVLTECPNEGCEEMVPHSLVQAHLDEDCPFTALYCRYSEAGCEIELPRRELKEHENDLKFHLQVVMKLMKYSHDKIAVLQNQLIAANAALQSDIKKLATATTYLQSVNTSLQSDVKKLTADNSSLQKELTTANVSLQSDIAKITAALQNTSKDNLLTFKVTDYRKKRDEHATFCSPSFYTSSGGYKMKILVDINGDEDGYISVYTKLVRGDYDDKLKWPFIGEVNITLLNQLEDAGHYKRTITIPREANFCVGNNWGNPSFLHRLHLRYNEKHYTQYLKDDTLYFRVSVWTKDNKPWLHCTV